MKEFQEACVGGFIQNNKGEVLFVKRSEEDDFLPGLWELPGGGVDFGESPQEALVREVLEEVGLTVEVKKPLSVDWYFMEKSDKKIQRVEITFLCKVISQEEVTLSFEHSEYRWVNEEQVKTVELTEYMRKAVESSWENV